MEAGRATGFSLYSTNGLSLCSARRDSGQPRQQSLGNTAATLVAYPLCRHFIFLALAQLGVFTLQLPAFIRERLQGADQNIKRRQRRRCGARSIISFIGGSMHDSAFGWSAAIYCQSGDAVSGGLALFSLGLGSGLPLLLAITIGMRWLPKPGHWMQSVNRVFAYALFATAIMCCDRF